MRKVKFRKVYCEITNVCNLKCEFCPSSADSKNEKLFMSEELFAKLIPQLQPLTYMLCLHILGEPMCHPKLRQFLDICSLHNMNISIVTNGTLLTEKHQLSLMHPAVKQINFSLQSFAANFPNLDNDDYLNAIFNFTKRTFKERPDLHLNFRLWNSEKFELSLIQNQTTINQIQNYFDIPNKIIENLSKMGNRLMGNLYLNFADRFEWPNITSPFMSDHGSCHALKTQFGILANGTVVPCCLDKDGIIDLGDSKKESLQEILNSKRAQEMVNGLKQRRLIEPLCQRCNFNKRSTNFTAS